jgi:hypothetical protein
MLPPYDLTADGPSYAPTVRKVAAILANFKCELHAAATNDKDVIPRYYDTPSLTTHYDDPQSPDYGKRVQDRRFTLNNLFEEIEYVGEAQFQIDVMATAGASPSFSFINPYSAATNQTWTVGANLSEEGHRYIYLYSSVDMERVVPSPPYGGGKSSEPPLAEFAKEAVCDDGAELNGSLGLQDNLMQHFVAADMNDLAVWPAVAGNLNQAVLPTAIGQYTEGQLQFQIDFTTTSGLNGGPLWTLKEFKGASGGGGGGASQPLSYTRTAKDTLQVIFLPICIRQKFHALNNKAPYRYTPELVEGTPRWANYLPPCPRSKEQDALKSNALSAAHAIITLKNR